MPNYDYVCKNCGKAEEKLESFSAPVEHDCSFCNQKLGMQRVFRAPNFTLAGDGWAKDGYAKGSKQ